ncbi:MAG TPA: ATP-dependent helicase HrpB, partial [Candidatus Cybelea sp.]|nr:ATP-dependent helicase HrpB [Candidatus Cybelea sp.]
MREALSVDAALPELKSALAANRNVVLVAPPGAGKTTRVPQALFGEPWTRGGKIVVLEPRRLAARAAASRVAGELGGNVGEIVGIRMRGDTRSSARTRIEFVTEGVLVRMLLADPALQGVAAVLFDEFHERSLDCDLGLALALDAREGLRDDLRIVVMSATLDAARVAALLGDAALIQSSGRMFPVVTRYVDREPHRPIEAQVADAVMAALANETGSLLVFLPGAREIRRAAAMLSERIGDPTVDVVPLLGALDLDEQRRAIAPPEAGRRKIVLATSIAETSLTIEGVRVVVDSGLSRSARYDPGSGLTELVTTRVSQASADQRRGRAGRTEPGVCYRLWSENETRALPSHGRPEILESDLTGLALALAEWGTPDPAALRWLDPPPAAAYAEAQELLRALNALDAGGRITTPGRALARLPLPPRLAHMVVAGAARGQGRLAARIAGLLGERGLGGRDVDLRHRLDTLHRERDGRARDLLRQANDWAHLAGADRDEAIDIAQAGAMLALAFPERIGKARPGGKGEFLLVNGRSARLDPSDALARETYLAVGEVAGAAADARILLAAPLGEDDIESEFASHMADVEEVRFDPDSRSVRARRRRRLGALTLSEAPLAKPGPELVTAALLQGIRELGLDALPWPEHLRQFRDRIAFLGRLGGGEWPDLTDAALLASLEQWLAPFLAGKRSLDELSAGDLGDALVSLVPPNLRRRLDADAPTHFRAPSGRSFAIDYAAEGGPAVSVRVQELFGLGKHPAVGGGREPLTLRLLSPANRPVQVTRDLPGFWRGSYAAVRAELRGRYPKH